MATPDIDATPPAGLPHEVTSFVGRRRECGAIRRLLGSTRLVTLTGFGGVGKTRLALRTAAQLRRAFADGAHFVSLAAVTDSALVAPTVATALGMQTRTRRAAPASLVDYLHEKTALLILDNCEHLVDEVARLVDTLLRGCPRIRVMATSREPLRIDGETVHTVAPLSVPPRIVDGPASLLHQYEAVCLFVDRATAVRPDFELSDADAGAVAQLCAELEGIPLAIELAAVRLRTMSPAELASNLSGRWAVLTRGNRTAPDRQRTMAACIEWSYELCSDVERDVWAAVSVFSDGFELDAAEGVCHDAGGDEPLAEVLAALVEKSVIVASPRDGYTRFRLLPPIRHRGLRRLDETSRLATMRRRHRDWYCRLAERAHDDWVGPRQVEWIRRLRREAGNLQTALGYCFGEPGEAEPGLRMGVDLHEFGLAEGLFHAGLMWFHRLLPLAPQPSPTRALALRTACWWSAASGDVAVAARLLVEGQQVADEVGGAAENLFTQTAGFVSVFAGDYSRAIELLDEALAVFRAEGDTMQVIQTLYLLQLAHVLCGRFESALRYHRDCLRLTESSEESWARGYSLWIAGFTHWCGGDIASAVTHYERALVLSRRIDDPVGIGLCFEALAWITVAIDPGRAAALLGAASALWDRIDTSTAALAGLFAHHRSAVAALSAELGASAFDAAWARGRSLSADAVIGLALGEDPVVGPAPSTQPVRDASSSGVLTKREQQIAALVARGMSNRDIADALVISRRTAETHVENILTKLGFTSRTHIVKWMADQHDSTVPATAAS